MGNQGKGKRAWKGSPKGKSFTKTVQDLGAPKPRKSKGQDSTKVHNTKGRNNHGRTKW